VIFNEVSSDKRDKVYTTFTLNKCILENPPSPNEHLNKGCRTIGIKASAEASHKTYTCISLKQRSNTSNYGLVCNLGKQRAETKGLFDIVS